MGVHGETRTGRNGCTWLELGTSDGAKYGVIVFGKMMGKWESGWCDREHEESHGPDKEGMVGRAGGAAGEKERDEAETGEKRAMSAKIGHVLIDDK